MGPEKKEFHVYKHDIFQFLVSVKRMYFEFIANSDAFRFMLESDALRLKAPCNENKYNFDCGKRVHLMSTPSIIKLSFMISQVNSLFHGQSFFFLRRSCMGLITSHKTPHMQDCFFSSRIVVSG